MSKVVEKLSSGNMLSAQQVERIGGNVADFVKAAKKDPRFKAQAMEKMSGFAGDFGKTLAMYGAVGLGSAAGVSLYRGISNKINESREPLVKAKHYKDMLEVHPELLTKGVDSTLVQRHFNTLYKFNPDYASDPMIAGTYVRNQMEYERPNLDSLNNIVKARTDIANASRTAPDPAHNLARAATGINETLGKLERAQSKKYKEPEVVHQVGFDLGGIR